MNPYGAALGVQRLIEDSPTFAPSPATRPALASPTALAVAYALFGLAWIWASGRVAADMALDAAQFVGYAAINGALFISTTALVLYFWQCAVRRAKERLPDVESRLQETRAQIISLVESAPDGVVVHDARCIYYANPAFRRLFELPDDIDLSRMRLRDLVDPAQLDLMRGRIEYLAGHVGAAAPVEVAFHTHSGKPLAVEHASCSVQLGGHILVQSHLRDLTARNEARRQYERLNSELELRVRERTAELIAANQALESFTYSVAHDLRAPVGRLDGFATVLAERIAANDTTRALHYAQRIKANASTMAAMIEGLLQVSRADRATLHLEPLDMGGIVDQVLEEFPESTRAAVVVQPLPPCCADASLLRQVWTNLLSNAIKYSSQASRPLVLVEGDQIGDEYVFSVSDNGVGFDPREASQLFHTFRRLSTGLAFSGTGVGLTVVRRIVQRHGGRVWAEGSKGGGARFSFSLPCGLSTGQLAPVDTQW